MKAYPHHLRCGKTENPSTRSARWPIAAVLLAVAALTCLASTQTASAADFYVATNGNDSWSGKLPAPNFRHTDGPFASVARAQTAVRTLVGTKAVTVQIRNGTYYLPVSPTNPGTLAFSSADSGTSSFPVLWQNYPAETPVISGGEPVGSGGFGLTWSKLSGTTNLWKVQLPSTVLPFEYLFYNGVRRLRARIHDSAGVGYYMSGGLCKSTQTGATVSTALCNLGTFLRVANTIGPNDPQGSGCPYTTASDGVTQKCLDRFKYSVPVNGDPITNWTNLNGATVPNQPCAPSNAYPAGDVELTLFDAWTVDAMRINCVDTTNQVIYLLCGSNGQYCGTYSGGGGSNYNFFGPLQNHRYTIENAKEAFQAAQSTGQTGLWYLDRGTTQPTLYYIANAGETPNTATVVLAQLGGSIPGAPATDYIGGSLISATNLNNVTFQGITFEVDNFYPSYTTGLNNDVNGEMSLPQAIDCESCQNVTFDTVTVRHTSSSGILIASASSTQPPAAQFDTIQNSTFLDIGDSGIRIGHRPTGNDVLGDVVNNITVQNNLIDGYSRVFADGEGVAQGNGNTISYLHNDILDGYHAGISVCQLACPGGANGVNGTNITSKYNHLRNLMQGITSDGGSLYYNIGGSTGSGSGDQIYNNLVHDTTDSSVIDFVNGKKIPGTAYGGEGLYLDAQSGGVDLENNVVYHMSGHAIHLTEGPTVNNLPNPNTFQNNIFSLAIAGMFTQGAPWPLINSPQIPSCDPSNPNLHIGLQVKLFQNVFNFDLNETNNTGFFVQGGCTDSCGLDYDKFQDFEGNAYWRAGTPGTGPLFCNDPMAFHLLTNPPTGTAAASCPSGSNTNLTFDSPNGGSGTWQYGAPPTTPVPINEDRLSHIGRCDWNPNFGTTGNPSDYLLSGGPGTGFDYTKTNDTINHAGRTGTFGAPPAVGATFPTYTFSSF